MDAAISSIASGSVKRVFGRTLLLNLLLLLPVLLLANTIAKGLQRPDGSVGLDATPQATPQALSVVLGYAITYGCLVVGFIFLLDLAVLWSLSRIGGERTKADIKVTAKKFGGSLVLTSAGLLGAFMGVAILVLQQSTRSHRSSIVNWSDGSEARCDGHETYRCR
jgi:hypothetical protein